MNIKIKGWLPVLLFTACLGLSSPLMAQQVAPININTADAALLEELPGIGPTRAAAIIQEREANGEFTDTDDLTRVSGIGNATVADLKDQVEF
ncbi:MAG: ComEA family DNA-binding protein [Halomonas sp.]|nr:ComEA family DNA-binding protein [Halomonas sp.]TVM08011.1 MAG: ComEA family DNA-binding protein [Halomonas sp.]